MENILIYLKRSCFTGKKTIVSVVVLALLFGALPIFKFWVNRAEADFIPDELSSLFQEERMAIVGNNTLLALASPSNPDPKVVKKLKVVATAYSSTVWQTDDTPFITASGTMVRDGILANNLLPLGTRVRIPDLYGDKIFVIEDRMNSRMSNYQIDIWFASTREAKNFGVKRTYIEVLER